MSGRRLLQPTTLGQLGDDRISDQLSHQFDSKSVRRNDSGVESLAYVAIDENWGASVRTLRCMHICQSKLWGEVGAEINPGRRAPRKGTNEFRVVQVSEEDPSPNSRVFVSAFEANSPIRFAGAPNRLYGSYGSVELADWTSHANHGMSVMSEELRAHAREDVRGRTAIKAAEGEGCVGPRSDAILLSMNWSGGEQRVGIQRRVVLDTNIDKGGRLRDRKMCKEKWGKEEATHWIDGHHCVDSALGWGTETSRTTGPVASLALKGGC
ncbi:hypothetical protein DFH08DRAFT_820777 [Mycena albidolilacea]|uniref:Uncharacterized protein n=1 Tax=Mycena albidolilacea TaxID=1033008 RepID=A0AAD6ZBI6_9AGAR|nr:hypothetical protein DFH08DRAFT_820777 [Mycena albidolilacea]